MSHHLPRNWMSMAGQGQGLREYRPLVVAAALRGRVPGPPKLSALCVCGTITTGQESLPQCWENKARFQATIHAPHSERWQKLCGYFKTSLEKGRHVHGWTQSQKPGQTVATCLAKIHNSSHDGSLSAYTWGALFSFWLLACVCPRT